MTLIFRALLLRSSLWHLALASASAFVGVLPMSASAQSSASGVLECSLFSRVCLTEVNGGESCSKTTRTEHVLAVQRTADGYALEDISEHDELNFRACAVKSGALQCYEKNSVTVTGETTTANRGFAVGLKDGMGTYSRQSRMSRYDATMSGRLSCRKRTDGTNLL